MGAIIQQPQIFTDHVARLERQNQMLKRVGLFLFFLCFFAIGLISWQVKKMSRVTVQQGATKIISANEFHLIDENGRTQGALIASSGGATLFLNGPNNKTGLMFNSAPGNGSSLVLMSPNKEQQVALDIDDAFSSVTVGARKSAGAKIQMLTAVGGGQSVTVSDSAGFQAVLGSASLVKPENGEITNTSVAAVTLFGKDGHVIWMTPRH